MYLLDVDFLPSRDAHKSLTIANGDLLRQIRSRWEQERVNTVMITPAFQPELPKSEAYQRECAEPDCIVVEKHQLPLTLSALRPAIEDGTVEVFEAKLVCLEKLRAQLAPVAQACQQRGLGCRTACL